MARRRTPDTAPTGDVRAYLFDRYHQLARRYDGLRHPDERPFGRTANRIAAGDLVTVHWWQLPKWLSKRPRSGRWAVHPDGRLSSVEQEQIQ